MTRPPKKSSPVSFRQGRTLELRSYRLLGRGASLTTGNTEGPDGDQPVGWVRYDQLERKETRLRADQYSRLTELSRELNRQRQGQGERITENTLIRVAIDLLLAGSDNLTGTTEAELRASIGL